MKKFLALLTAVIMLLSFTACNNAGESATSDEYPYGTVVGGEISWSDTKADSAIVGSWQLEDESQVEYYVFTEECKVMVVRGSVYWEGSASYGIDEDGIRSYFSEFQYLYGQLTYTIDGDTLTFLDLDGTTQVLKRSTYTPPVLEVPEDFKVDEKLVGYFYNEEYKDSYEFLEDGTAFYKMDLTDEQGYLSGCKYTYSVKDGKVTLNYHDGKDYGNETFDYTVDSTTLVINGNSYTRVLFSDDDVV